jgi:protein gp37
MAENSSIEWTDTTWNPVTGCTKISVGCDNCYASRFSERFRGVPGHPFETGFDLTLRPERLQQPLSWKRPRMIFVNSMSDLFHKDIPQDHISAVFDTMEKANWHVYQVLTKRSSLLQKFINARYRSAKAPAHMWFGVSVENQPATSRITHLQNSNAGVRFLSIEPLIAPVDRLSLKGIDWVIVGGESGPRARPMDPRWVTDIRDQCVAAGVAFFFKQWGGFSAKNAGRLLEGREWNQFPTKRPVSQQTSFELRVTG